MINWFCHMYPYGNLHELNLDWVIDTVKQGEKEIADFIGVNTIKYANPILWNIESQYEANTVVVDGQTGNAYISVKAVPSGVHLNREEYWTQIYNYANVIDTLREQIAYDEGESTTATRPYAIDNLVFVNSILYRVIAPMIAGDSFVTNSNAVQTTINDVIMSLISRLSDLGLTVESITTIIGALDDLTTTDKTSIVNAINEINANTSELSGNVDTLSGDVDTLSANIGVLNDLTTTDKTSIVNAINELNLLISTLDSNLVNEIEARENGDAELRSLINNIINGKYYVPGNNTPVIGVKGSQDWLFSDGTNLEQYTGGFWPNNIHHDYMLNGYTAPINTDASLEVAQNTMIIASQSNDSQNDPHDNVAIQGIAFTGEAEGASMFGGNFIAGTKTTTQSAKLVGVEVDIQPGSNTNVTEGAGIIVNAFNKDMPITAIGIYGLNGSFGDGITFRQIANSCISIGSNPGRMKSLINTQNADFRQALIVAPVNQYLLLTKDSQDNQSSYVVDENGTVKIVGSSGVSISSSTRANMLYINGDKLGTNSPVINGANSGSDTLPSNPVGFIPIEIRGSTYKIPIYGN